MNPGDVVRCIDARYSEGRLVDGRVYVVNDSTVRPLQDTTPEIPMGHCHVRLIGIDVDKPKEWWKSSRFIPVNRKDLETEILAKVADKIMGGVK